jgi:uncharacterized protein (TIGR02652 family)
MINYSFQYPIFGPEIKCPHCRQVIQALTLTDTYLCDRHGAFEANPDTEDLVHLESGRHWRLWQNQWYRQHTHPDGIRFEIHEALDSFYTQGFRVIKIIIAQRYRQLIYSYLASGISWENTGESKLLKLYGIPVEFSPDNNDEPRWNIINFTLETESAMNNEQ